MRCPLWELVSNCVSLSPVERLCLVLLGGPPDASMSLLHSICRDVLSGMPCAELWSMANVL